MRTPSRRTLLKGAAAVGVGVATGPWVVGCGADRKSEKRLSFWGFTDTRFGWQQKAWELYKKQKKPGFEIDWLILPYRQMHDQLLVTAQARSGGPDIVDVEVSQFPRFIKGNEVLFHDLRPHLEERGQWKNLFQASGADPWSFRGKTYGLGNELNACLLAYRTDIWEQAGIDPELASWDDFATAARDFHDKTGNYLLDHQFTDPSSWWMMALQKAGGYFDAQGRPTLDSAASREVLGWMQESVKDGWATLRPIGQAFWVALEQGKIASQIGPSWQFSGFTQQNIPKTSGKWNVRPFPRWTTGATGGGSRTATHGGTGVSVSKLGAHSQEAIDFVLWEHTTTAAVMYDFEARAVWPTYAPAFEDPRLTQPIKFFGGQKVGDIIRDVSDEINPVHISPFWQEVTDAFTRLALTPTLQSTGADAGQLLAGTQREAEKLIDFGSA